MHLQPTHADPTGGAYSAPPDPLAGSGAGSHGRENWKEWKTGGRRKREERGKGARRTERRDDRLAVPLAD